MLSIAICTTAYDSSENQMSLHAFCHAASLPDIDILPWCHIALLSIAICATAPDTSENPMASHD